MKKINRIRRWAAACLALVFAVILAGTALADEGFSGRPRVIDQAGLFDETELEALLSAADSLRETTGMDLVILTAEENPDTPKELADSFYEEGGFGTGESHDGALFLIDMDNGEIYISSEGQMLRYLTDERVDQILDDAYEYAYEEDFYGAAAAFLDGVETCYRQGIENHQYNVDSETGAVSRYRSIRWYEALVALIAAAACGGFAVLSVVREYGMKDESGRLSANFSLSYRKDSEFTLGNRLADVMIGSYVTQAVIASERNRSSGGSSGGRGSSGRTTTHRSSSGRVHGGGGRKFR